MSLQSDLLTGELLDEKYRVESALGHGGMGSVYRATHLGTKRPVAIKVIHPQFVNDEEFILRFQREAEAAGRLRHPNVVDVTDFGFAKTSNGKIAYLVMEYLDGCTLAELLDHEPRLPLDFAVDILEQTCSAVDEAHRRGIIHRDLKPENIWLEPNRRGGYTIKVLDFGLAKLSNLPATVPVGAATSGGTRTEAGLPTGPASPRSVAAEPGQDQTQILPQAPGDGSGKEDLAESAVAVGPETAAPAQLKAVCFVGDAGDTPTQILSPATDNTSNGPGATTPAGSAAGPFPAARAMTNPDVDGVDAATQILSNAPTVPDPDGPHPRTNALTRVGSVMGTPLYMSPEQFRGEALDSRSDIYSLGVIAYRMLAGETPFSGDMIQLGKLLAEADRPLVRAKNRKVPRSAAQLITSALAKDPADRPQTAAGFAAAFRARAERTGGVFRQAFSLYSERFPAFFKLSLVAYAPLAALLGLAYLLDDILGVKEKIAGFIPLFVVAFMGCHLLAYSVISSATVAIVTRLSLAPLRPVDLRLALRGLKQSWLSFLAALLLVSFVVFFVLLVFLIGGVTTAVKLVQYTSRAPHWFYKPFLLSLLLPALGIAGRYCLFAPVIAIEHLRPVKALRRAAALMKRDRVTVAAIILVQFALPFLLYVLFNGFSVTFSLEAEHQNVGFNFQFTNASTQLLNVFSTPLISIMTALVYLKARRAGGELVDEDSASQLIGDRGFGRVSWAPWRKRTRSNSVSEP